jgi:hypothetical protein
MNHKTSESDSFGQFILDQASERKLSFHTALASILSAAEYYAHEIEYQEYHCIKKISHLKQELKELKTHETNTPVQF